MPGLYIPRDLGLPNKGKFFEVAKKTTTAVDWWEGDIRYERKEFKGLLPEIPEQTQIYYLRPATKGAKQKFDASWGGHCVHHTKNGCKFKFENRPYECRMLEPSTDFRCEIKAPAYSKPDIVFLWLPYQHLFKELKENT
jgi:hypothetical protein